MPRLPDVGALGARPVPTNRTGIASQDTTAAGIGAARFGQTIAQSGVALGDELQRNAARRAEEQQRFNDIIQKRDDEQQVLEYRRALIDWDKTNVRDPETGARSKLGKDAFDLPKTLVAQFDEFSAKAAENITSERARRLAQEMALGRREQIGEWATNHALQQRSIVDEADYKANVQAFKDNATLYPVLAQQEIEGMAQATRSRGRRLGMGAAAIEDQIKADASEVHGGIVLSMVKEGDVSGAEAYFKANASEMNSKTRDLAQGALKESVARSKSQAFADEWGDKPLAEALTEARKRFTGVEEEAAVQAIKVRAAEREAIKAQSYKDNTDAAWKVITNGGSKKQIPVGVWNGLGGEEQRQINDYVEAKWRRAKADAEGKADADMEKYYGLRMMAAENPEAFSKLDLMKSEPYISKQQLSHLVELQAGISKGDAKAMDSQATVKRTVALVRGEILNAGIDLTPKEGTPQAKANAAFFASLTQALDDATASKKAPLTDDEAKRIGMGMLREGVVRGSGIIFDDKKRGYQLTPEERGKFVTPYDKIPDAIRAEIEADLYPGGAKKGFYGSGGVDKARVERIYQRALDAGRVK